MKHSSAPKDVYKRQAIDRKSLNNVVYGEYANALNIPQARVSWLYNDCLLYTSHSFPQAGDGVMVCYRQGGKADLLPQTNQFPGSERTVGGGGVGMQVGLEPSCSA